MTRRRSVWSIAVAVGALLGTLGIVGASAKPRATADATAVMQWNLIAVSTITGVPGPGLPGPAGGAPPASQINMGMVQGAVYDAVNAITPKHHRPYLLKRRFGNTASDDAAVATAAYLVLKNIVETVPQSVTFPNRATLLATLASQYEAAKNAIPDSPFKDKGIAAGTAAAQAMIDARKDDGRFGPSQFVPNANPGYWDPVAPNGTTALDPTPWAGGVEPFLMKSSSQFRSAGPPALNSAAWAADFNEVKALGGDGVVTPSARTATQTYIAKWWQSNPVASWNDVARQLIARNHLDAADSARLLAMQNLAAADAAINTWNDKYHFSFWRPFQAIRRAGEPAEGNPATLPDPTWTPLLSAPYPEHVSGHLGLDSSHTTVLRMFFGNAPAGGYQITSFFVNPGGPATRSFSSFSQAIDEIVQARIWAGLHFRTADLQAVELGENVANFAAANFDSAATRLVAGLAGGSGSTVGPGGALYVTETAAGRVSRVDPRTGAVTTYASGLPPAIPAVGLGGAMDVAFFGGTAYVLVTLVGPDVGGDDVVGIYRVNGSHDFTVIADIGAWSIAHPPATAFEVPSGVQYAMEKFRNGFLVTDGHHNRVLWVTRNGAITEVIAFGNIVPTGLQVRGNTVYMAEAGPTPHLPENGKVVSFRPRSDSVTQVASGGRLLVDVEFGPRHDLFALAQGEFTPGNPAGSPANPNTGELLRVDGRGGFAVVEEGLNQPTSLEFIRNTAYVITLGGEIWKIDDVTS